MYIEQLNQNRDAILAVTEGRGIMLADNKADARLIMEIEAKTPISEF
jgi:hypothetical protein